MRFYREKKWKILRTWGNGDLRTSIETCALNTGYWLGSPPTMCSASHPKSMYGHAQSSDMYSFDWFLIYDDGFHKTF